MRWLDAPPSARLAAARTLLTELGAFDGGGRLTARGRELVRLPVHPRLGSMLLTARERGLLPLGCGIAALLEERDAFRGARGADLRERLAGMRSNPGAFRNQLVQA